MNFDALDIDVLDDLIDATDDPEHILVPVRSETGEIELVSFSLPLTDEQKRWFQGLLNQPRDPEIEELAEAVKDLFERQETSPMARYDFDLDHIFTYHAPTPEQAKQHQKIKDAAKEFARVVIANTPASPDQTIAVRKIREASMYASAVIALGGRLYKEAP